MPAVALEYAQHPSPREIAHGDRPSIICQHKQGYTTGTSPEQATNLALNLRQNDVRPGSLRRFLGGGAGVKHEGFRLHGFFIIRHQFLSS